MEKALIIVGIILDFVCLSGMIIITVLKLKNKKNKK